MKKVMKKAKLFVERVQEMGIPVKQAFIFGSYAKGNPKIYSDIDICIVSPSLGKDFVEEIVQLDKISRTIDSRLEPIPFNPKRLNDPYDPLAAEIRKYGKALL